MSDGFVNMVFWSLLTVLVSYINLKSPKARIVLDGTLYIDKRQDN